MKPPLLWKLQRGEQEIRETERDKIKEGNVSYKGTGGPEGSVRTARYCFFTSNAGSSAVEQTE
jgi:hypothetical protein